MFDGSGRRSLTSPKKLCQVGAGPGAVASGECFSSRSYLTSTVDAAYVSVRIDTNRTVWYRPATESGIAHSSFGPMSCDPVRLEKGPKPMKRIVACLKPALPVLVLTAAIWSSVAANLGAASHDEHVATGNNCTVASDPEKDECDCCKTPLCTGHHDNRCVNGFIDCVHHTFPAKACDSTAPDENR